MIETKNLSIQILGEKCARGLASWLEVPPDKTVLKILIGLGGRGNAHTKTLKAWTEDQGAKVLAEVKQS